MRFREHLVVVRGGGDLASGVIYQLHRAGFPVIVLELERPLAIRRAVSFAAAVDEGSVMIEGVKGALVQSASEAAQLAADGRVAVLINSSLPAFDQHPSVVVDARMAKRNLDTQIDQAPLVIGLGPGFDARVDCDVVIETMRGHRLGRAIESGPALPDSGIPGDVEGVTIKRLVKAPKTGMVGWDVSIGDSVTAGQSLGLVGDATVIAGVDGVVRGLISPGYHAAEGLKIADIDPRGDRSACFEISDKARLVGAGVLGAVLEWANR